MYFSKSHFDAAMNVQAFYYEHRKQPQSERNQLVEDKIEELVGLGYGVYRLQTWLMRHPATARKGRKALIMDVLTDFILEAPQKELAALEYPIHNADKTARTEIQRTQNEVSIMVDRSESDGNRLKGVVYENEQAEFTEADSVEKRLFAESDLSEPNDLAAALIDLRKKPAKAARKFANDDRSKKDVMKAVRALDVLRVRRCEQCGQAYYAHDLRLMYCDIIAHPLNRKYHYCEYEVMLENGRKSDGNLDKSTILAKENTII